MLWGWYGNPFKQVDPRKAKFVNPCQVEAERWGGESFVGSRGQGLVRVGYGVRQRELDIQSTGRHGSAECKTRTIDPKSWSIASTSLCCVLSYMLSLEVQGLVWALI